MTAEEEATLLTQEYAAWGRAADAWLTHVDSCVHGRLMPADVAEVRTGFGELVESLSDLSRRFSRSPSLGPPPVDFDTLERRVAELQIPTLTDRILAQFPVPGAAGREEATAEEINLPAAVSLLDLLEGVGPKLFRRRIGSRRRQQLCKDLAAHGRRYHRVVMDGFAALERPAGQDPQGSEPLFDPTGGRESLRNANFNQIRMDLLHWLLDALGDRKAADQIGHLSRITARTAVRCVDRDLVAYLETHDPSTRVRLRPVLEAVDEAIALIRAALVRSESASGELHYFVRDMGEEVAAPFIRHMGLLVIALFDDLQAANARRTLSHEALRGGLQRMEEVLAFCRLIDHPMGREAYARAIRVVRRRGDRLVADLGAEAGREGAPKQVANARASLLVVKEFVERWRDSDRQRPGATEDSETANNATEDNATEDNATEDKAT